MAQDYPWGRFRFGQRCKAGNLSGHDSMIPSGLYRFIENGDHDGVCNTLRSIRCICSLKKLKISY